MKIRIVAVGRVREQFIRAGIDEYAKRLKPYARLDIVETREEQFKESFSEAEKQQVMRREGEHILKALRPGYVVASDVHGMMLSSEAIAAHIDRLRIGGTQSFQFVIGGSLGMAAEVLQRSDFRLSLGPITLPHQLCRLVLVEQLYRVTTILHGVPYHR